MFSFAPPASFRFNNEGNSHGLTCSASSKVWVSRSAFAQHQPAVRIAPLLLLDVHMQQGSGGLDDSMCVDDFRHGCLSKAMSDAQFCGDTRENFSELDGVDLGRGGGRDYPQGPHRRGGGGDGGSSGGGGSGGKNDGSGEGFLCRIWPGWRRRVAADSEFPFKVLMEETVGLGLAASGMFAARGKEILNELDFAFCDIAVGATLNFILVYLLSPSALAPGMRPASGFSKIVASLPANVFASGQFSIPQRISGFLYKGSLFAICGFLGSMVGTSLSQGLITIRKTFASRDGRKIISKPLPNLATTSLAWAGFMFFSSNPRYQAIAGIERVFFAKLPETVAKMGCAGARTANNVIGGAIWVWWARALGIQERPTAD